MTVDFAERLRDWGSRLEHALGIPILVSQTGALMLRTKGDNVFGIAPVAGQRALIFTGVIGVAEKTMSADTLRALLAINLRSSFSGMGCVGFEPESQEILFRLIWTPVEASWTEQAFAVVLAAFSEHVDALASAVASREIEQLLTASSRNSSSDGHRPSDMASLA